MILVELKVTAKADSRVHDMLHRAALAQYNIEIKESTLQCNLSAGRKPINFSREHTLK